jgi:hypothetical protein
MPGGMRHWPRCSQWIKEERKRARAENVRVFDDAKREHITDIPEGTETNIFFIQKKGKDEFTIGYSNVIHRIEKYEETYVFV